MNGRIYDARIGRFLQADPFIQAAGNTQSYNRYAYVMNNPLNATDPSGYFLKKLWNKVRPFVGVIVAIAATYLCDGNTACGSAAWAWIGGVSGAAGAAANGGNILQGAVTGFISAAAFYGVGQSFGAGGSFANASAGTKFAWAASQGMVGGVMSVLQDGKFGHGFASAFLTKFANVNSIVGTESGLAAARVMVAAMIGGTISEMTGGKFANGAATAALMQAVNGNKEAEAAEAKKIHRLQAESRGPSNPFKIIAQEAPKWLDEVLPDGDKFTIKLGGEVAAGVGLGATVDFKLNADIDASLSYKAGLMINPVGSFEYQFFSSGELSPLHQTINVCYIACLNLNTDYTNYQFSVEIGPKAGFSVSGEYTSNLYEKQ